MMVKSGPRLVDVQAMLLPWDADSYEGLPRQVVRASFGRRWGLDLRPYKSSTAYQPIRACPR